MRIDLVALGITRPDDMVSIVWEVDGSSGSTQCEAWRGQHEIDKLTSAGYIVREVRRFT